MKETLQKIRNKEEGFTLAELLVVVAIIAVLVAIAIPVFTSSLANASAQTDAANIRAGYASAMVKVLDGKNDDGKAYLTAGGTFYLNSDGSVTTDASGSYTCKGNAGDLQDANNEVIGATNAGTIGWKSGDHIKYEWKAGSNGADGTLSIYKA